MVGPPFKIISVCKGGGYKYCRTDPPHPNRNSKGLYPLHRVKVENKIGRLLTYNDIVHHKDGDKCNDNIDNLELVDRGEHTALHNEVKRVKYTCPVCNNVMYMRRRKYLYKKRQNKSDEVTCSRSCGSIIGRKLNND